MADACSVAGAQHAQRAQHVHCQTATPPPAIACCVTNVHAHQPSVASEPTREDVGSWQPNTTIFARHRHTPFATPLFCCCMLYIIVIAIAGSHGLRRKPIAKDSMTGRPKTGMPTPPLTNASTMPGMRSRRTATGPTRLKIYTAMQKQYVKSAISTSSWLQQPRIISGGAHMIQSINMQTNARAPRGLVQALT